LKSRFYLFWLLAHLSVVSLAQQTVGAWKDEKLLYAETKQVNQFFRRFNSEEKVDGSRLYQGKDSLYRDPKARPKFLKMIFDNENPALSKDLKNAFIAEVTNKSKPQYLDFHGGQWFAELKTTFTYKGKELPLTMFLKLQDAKIGSKWVIDGVSFREYSQHYQKDSTDSKYFLHPLSHEVDFMNIHKIFENNSKNIFEYTSADFKPDMITLFCEDVKSGALRFQTVQKLKLHFFQIDGWYFELNEFNRSGANTGWLISNLSRASDKEKKQLEEFIRFKND
jgi:hypothetical protein